MKRTIFVNLEVVVVDDQLNAEAIADAVFDHACQIDDSRIDHIAGMDYNVVEG